MTFILKSTNKYLLIFPSRALKLFQKGKFTQFLRASQSVIRESPALESCELLVQYEESQEPGCTVQVEDRTCY